jgi:prepilin-type N-terminal cleavage/methylation domain-containing protein
MEVGKMSGHPSHRGFTIVELLVVVTIIVVLLALLMPAMNKATYQAALVVCSGSQKAIVTGTLQYAFGNNRMYPDRQVPGTPAVKAIQPHKLADPVEGGSPPNTYDMRPLIRPYIQINKQLNDPLVDPVDLDKPSQSGTAPDTHFWSSTYLWFGWRYTLNARPLAGMFKIGDRFAAETIRAPMQSRRYNILVSDIDTEEGSAYSSHPDRAKLANVLAEGGPWITGGFITTSIWKGPSNRNPLDLNYGYDDGSVRRVVQVEYRWGPSDEMDRIPNFYDGTGGAVNMPRQ